MTNITINTKNNTIVITKAFEKKASKFNSKEYLELKDAKADFPTFRVVAKASSRNKTFKGLTFDFMETYIAAHDDAERRMETFNDMKNAKALYGKTMPYAEITTWFLNEYPTVKKFREGIAA